MQCGPQSLYKEVRIARAESIVGSLRQLYLPPMLKVIQYFNNHHDRSVWSVSWPASFPFLWFQLTHSSGDQQIHQSKSLTHSLLQTCIFNDLIRIKMIHCQSFTLNKSEVQWTLFLYKQSVNCLLLVCKDLATHSGSQPRNLRPFLTSHSPTSWLPSSYQFCFRNSSVVHPLLHFYHHYCSGPHTSCFHHWNSPCKDSLPTARLPLLIHC